MKDNKTEITIGGTSFTSLLFIVFLILKLTGVITWSWWWVTAPLWGGFAILLAIGILVLLYLCIMFIITGISSFLSE